MDFTTFIFYAFAVVLVYAALRVITARNPVVTRAIATAAAPHLDEAATRASHNAASLMAMNNVYYRFLHYMEGGEYGLLPARLRMQAIGNPGVDHAGIITASLADAVTWLEARLAGQPVTSTCP